MGIGFLFQRIHGRPFLATCKHLGNILIFPTSLDNIKIRVYNIFIYYKKREGFEYGI